MNRNRMILMGAVMWTSLGIDLLMHHAIGDDVALVAAALGCAGWLALRGRRTLALVGVRSDSRQ